MSSVPGRMPGVPLCVDLLDSSLSLSGRLGVCYVTSGSADWLTAPRSNGLDAGNEDKLSSLNKLNQELSNIIIFGVTLGYRPRTE
ncbi:hypothetical protein N7539_000550 [Penicillium diatomitis]|uniref:Uncharacterized protein n=1 Tax=Penicillium diatomitis TaxID=2819901 RepID=A0A9W9XM07_9EURO|nr:uncharacterized protein N7539_000550 [Penicillium diatomitis]KAJ5495434.1 hypothetical protein N7539_000550 [Penicillium diatomitis]